MALVCVRLGGSKDCKQGKVKVCQEPEKCDHVDGSCMCLPGWKGEDCKQGKVKVCQVPEKCDHVDCFCMCRGGGKVTFYQVPKCNNVNFSYMYQPLVEKLSIK